MKNETLVSGTLATVKKWYLEYFFFEPFSLIAQNHRPLGLTRFIRWQMVR
jgi:hypothetical protein